MARVQAAVYEKPSKSKRPGVHAKSKSSSLKTVLQKDSTKGDSYTGFSEIFYR